MKLPMPDSAAITLVALLAFAPAAWSQDSADAAPHSRCRVIHAELVESSSTTGCLPPATSCFLGVVDGNHGLRGVTHFAADSARAGPPTSPDFISYSGLFHYTTARGTLRTRETGVTNPGSGQPQSGAVTAYQQLEEGTGDYAGYTGYFFVSGRRVDDVITTRVTGELCRP
ncbi:hypothetical protein [Tahibacter amnicola]|uniref:Uncharacterized protein n=1 Tax=Tahibacter amnicola TaxID=2976241 RepID=A0ABY6BFM2_9GAMM|nr:hypothetical protein [Tahibacter amnicola]UXI68824.1 hypothetical protein N4264_03985 [Tahibacter amnicola]